VWRSPKVYRFVNPPLHSEFSGLLIEFDSVLFNPTLGTGLVAVVRQHLGLKSPILDFRLFRFVVRAIHVDTLFTALYPKSFQ
jgi:hypothetical protein